MPELPEVEIQRRNLERWWSGRRVLAIRVADAEAVRQGAVESLVGRVVAGVRRRGKHLIVDFEGEPGVCALLHLRMTGKIVPIGVEGRPGARLEVEVEGAGRFAFLDTRRLGHLDVLSPEAMGEHGPLEAMGPEPWPRPLGGAEIQEALRGTGRAIKVALMDQAVIAGVGNIVAIEALWVAGIDPSAIARELEVEALGRIGRALREVCEAVIVAEEGDEIAYLNDPGQPRGENPFSIYQQEICPRCGGAVGRLTQSGRTTYWCPSCQR